jgi:hypothetical protein
MNLTIHALKYPREGFKKLRYMEHYLWIGKKTGIRNFMDRLEILSTYLPLFPPLRGELFNELSDIQKANIFMIHFLIIILKKNERG